MKTSQIATSIFILFILVFTQCKKSGSHAMLETVNGHNVIHCDISKVKDSIDLPLSDLVKDCELVQLETNDQSIFKGTHAVGISPNYIAIKSNDYPAITVKLFSRDGKFIRNIGAIGKGPGEYQSLYGIQLDEASNRIYLTPFANARYIQVFDLEGNALPEIPLAYQQTKCRVYVKDNVVTVLSMPFNDQIPPAYQQTTGGKVIQELPRMQQLILRPDFSSEISSDYNADAFDMYVMGWGKKTPDTLYHYETDKNELVPEFVVTNGDTRIGSWSRELKSHYYAFLFDKPYQGKKVIVDKGNLSANFFRIINDYYGGFEVNKFFMSNNGMFISAIPSIDLMKTIDDILKKNEVDKKTYDRLAQVRKSLNENDNEILFIGEMK
ncbi:6-bladed beta-propeller [Saccharicrinis sp. FJH2]|uniref:6-bladed beta-propeller n=1 Tax=Saccharicrinis sp. FJH65 TaxID=3344659 RepID=UPI0035F23EFC